MHILQTCVYYTVYYFIDNPAIIPVSKLLQVMFGSNVTMKVQVSGYPLVASNEVHWYRPNGSEIQEGEAVFEDEKRSLAINNVQFSDAGVYLCVIRTGYGSNQATIELEVNGMKIFCWGLGGWFLNHYPDPTYIVEGGELTYMWQRVMMYVDLIVEQLYYPLGHYLHEIYCCT